MEDVLRVNANTGSILAPISNKRVDDSIGIKWFGKSYLFKLETLEQPKNGWIGSED